MNEPSGPIVALPTELLKSGATNEKATDIQPTYHVMYAEKVKSIVDGLPKFKTFPAAFGGSDETLEE